MPKTMLAMATISVSGPLIFCTGGTVTLTANSGSQYLWSPGGQTTRSVTISSAGTYTVRVTNSSGLNATSSPVVVAITSTGTPPSISASGHASFCAGGNIVLTSSLASNYLWSNGATTQAITVSTAGSYTVRTTSGSCVGTSSPLIVTVTSAPPIPVITANGPLDICDGTDITLTSSSSNGYLWSNGETTQSIIVSTTGNYSVRVYSGLSCSSESVESAVVVHSIPATPVISAGGPLHLSMTNTSVTLTSTTAYSYLWSNGASVRDITVTLPGTYYVTIESASGCTSTSSSIVVTSDNCTPPPVPVITLSGSSIIMAGDSVTLTASSGSGYLWSTGETTQSIIVSNDGTFSVSVYSGPACYSTSGDVTISVLVSTDINNEFTNESVNQIKIYPNPVDDEFLLSFKIEQMKSFDLKIYDVCGREIIHQKIIGIRGENNVFVNVSEVKPGIYFAYLNDGEHKEMVKVIVE